MSTDDRIRRPPIERTAPVRNWSTLLNSGSRTASDGESGTNGGPPSGLSDVVSRSVALGYQVVEEYVRQGERAARMVTTGYPTETATGDAQDLVQRIGQYASELVGAWLELVQRTANASARPNADDRKATPKPEGVAPAASARPQASRSTRVRIAIRCSRPVEVAVELTPDAAGARLFVQALRACDEWKPRVENVHASADGDEVPLLCVGISDDHPPGAYEGLIVDEATNRPVGILRVTVAAIDAPPG